MVVCRKRRNGTPKEMTASAERPGPRAPGSQPGGPVFLPRRKPSPIAEALMADLSSAAERVAASDELGSRVRPRAQ